MVRPSPSDFNIYHNDPGYSVLLVLVVRVGMALLVVPKLLNWCVLLISMAVSYLKKN